jgi:hypothetical protein
MKINDMESVRKLIAEAETWYVWLTEYSITHHFMRIVLHQNAFPRGAEVLLDDVLHFTGALQGGPYRLELAAGDTIIDGPRSAPTHLLIGNGGALRIQFVSAAIESIRK